MKQYRTIVADPPWPMPKTGKTTRGETDSKGVYTAKGGRVVDGRWWGRHRGNSVELPYDTMSLEEIAALKVGDVAEDNSHLYLWTTNRFLWDARAIAEAWGFKFSTLLTWCKTPMGIGFGGAFTLTSEYVLFCRRGKLAPQERHDSTWFRWQRPYENGHIAHSAKPDAFLDLVEQVSPGPYLEMFARRARFGWDYYGDESLGTAEVAAWTPGRCPKHGPLVGPRCPSCEYEERPVADCQACCGTGKRWSLAATLAVSNPEAPCPDCASGHGAEEAAA